MIKSNLRELLLRKENDRTRDARGRIHFAYSVLTGSRTLNDTALADFAEVLEQVVVPVAFRNEVLPILLEGSRSGPNGLLEAAEAARNRALVRCELDYDWHDTDALPTPQVPLFPKGLDGLAQRENGFAAAPSRYTQSDDGRETIDRIRDVLGDERFLAYCEGNEVKYKERAGAKGDPVGDAEKALWYERMARHMRNPALSPDPRQYRTAGATEYKP